MLDHRVNPDPLDRGREGYLLFRHMLGRMRESHPSKRSCLPGGRRVAA